MAAQMPKLTTGAAESVEPPLLSRRAHLHLVPDSSASLASDFRSRAAVMWLRAKQMLRWRMTVLQNFSSSASIKEPSLLLIVCHHFDRLIFLNKIKKCRSINQSTNLDYLVQCVLPRKGPVRLPQHLQYINRSSSPIRSQQHLGEIKNKVFFKERGLISLKGPVG